MDNIFHKACRDAVKSGSKIRLTKNIVDSHGTPSWQFWKKQKSGEELLYEVAERYHCLVYLNPHTKEYIIFRE